ncbi:hypothetical protein [Sphingomonas morindae]|uniref:Chorismate lyase n=1 Tax=Sphingomonas morindae TaxID=1541170 RepID=A0ABY4X6M5_9SPHN|nr:hypothetical protein [Sphingomonas morindae]USI72558.1 hypothetical protein LHA26_14915 [Sphingomonas morindae]
MFAVPLLLALAAAPAWPDTPLARAEALAAVQTLNADLLSHDSATLTLERWCDRHRIATPATVVADRETGAAPPPPEDLRARLAVGPDEPIAYRRVALRCGDMVLSRADNWYVPARLTAAMNAALASSDTPFGKVVRPLGFQRHTLSARLLWSPLPAEWDVPGAPPPPKAPAGATLRWPDALIEHRAVLVRADGLPFSLVVERYAGAVLAFPPPAAR